MLNVTWSHRLEKLAAALSANLGGEQADRAEDVLKYNHCVVVPNKMLQFWFQHHYLYDESGPGMRVLANMDYPLLHQFVNDWLYRMSRPDDRDRNPQKHPFAVSSMTWRLYNLFGSGLLNEEKFTPLRQYIHAVGDDGPARDLRRYRLSSRVAQLLDQYQVYRPCMVREWEGGIDKNAEKADLAWQPELWRKMTEGSLSHDTYLDAFFRMEVELSQCGITEAYQAVHVFGLSMMPRVYAVFFYLLSREIPVHMYCFNPCRQGDWFDMLTKRQAEKLKLECGVDEDELLETGNGLLSVMGRGARDFLGNITDMTGGQVDPDFNPLPDSATLLGRIQSGILNNCEGEAVGPVGDDSSFQVGICHSPMREVEVLRDALLRWFTADQTLQPRHIQVHVSDMALYAPYIDAVFATLERDRKDTIPYAIADRVALGESLVGEAFSRLLALADSRFTAPELMELLQCESIHRAFGFEDTDLETVHKLISSSGIRWGRDAGHRNTELEIEFDEHTTWKYGLDRLLLGYAVTGDDADLPAGLPLPCDRVEGSEAELLGKLARFVDCLHAVAVSSARERTPAQWSEFLAEVVGTFFASTSDTYRDVSTLQQMVESLKTTSEAAGFDRAVPVQVIRDYMAGQLDNATGGRDLVRNGVVFSALRAGASAPRRIVCMLGMGDGKFPRSDSRPAYDLFRIDRHHADPSLRVEDRMAFLESVMSARERLYITYVGRTVKENEEIPPSTVLAELMEYVEAIAGKDAVKPLEHKLQPFHRAYFDGNEQYQDYFSYDKANCRAARRIAGEKPAEKVGKRTLPEDDTTKVDLEELVRFFSNPAKVFFRNVLKAYLDGQQTAGLEADEEFDPRGLTGFEVRQAVVDGILAARQQDSVYAELCSAGLVPLEAWGRKWFEEQWQAVREIMDTHIAQAGTLADLLNRQEVQENRELELDVGGRTVAVSGAPAVVAGDDGSRVALDFRCASEKARDKLSSWIRHLFACAVDAKACRFCVQGKDADELKTTIFEPQDPQVAREFLSRLVALYISGHHAVPLFTPGTSCAYVDGSMNTPDSVLKGKGKKTEEEARREYGLKQAADGWYSDPAYNKFRDDLDPYFRQAFGADGPVKQEGFSELADSICGPMFSAIKGDDDA